MNDKITSHKTFVYTSLKWYNGIDDETKLHLWHNISAISFGWLNNPYTLTKNIVIRELNKALDTIN
jgi:predicted ferric reductase